MGSSGPIKAATSPLNKIKDKVSGVVAPAAAVAQAPFDTAKKARRELNTAADDTSNAASRLARAPARLTDDFKPPGADPLPTDTNPTTGASNLASTLPDRTLRRIQLARGQGGQSSTLLTGSRGTLGTDASVSRATLLGN